MFAYDFEYDDKNLSDFGFILCEFDGSSDFDTVSAGSVISFSTVPMNGGKHYGLSSTQYDECITGVFQICKDPCIYDDGIITQSEQSDIMRWLNRRRFLKLRMIYEEESETTESDEDSIVPVFYDASFNVSKIVVNKELYGFELEMTTNSPHGYGEETVKTFNITDVTEPLTIDDESGEIGYTSPVIEITCSSAGDLEMKNTTFGITSVIDNCSSGEVITMDSEHQIISTSLNSHHLYDDFNFEFMKIGNTLDSRQNNITVSIPCIVKIKYKPVIKDAPV